MVKPNLAKLLDEVALFDSPPRFRSAEVIADRIRLTPGARALVAGDRLPLRRTHASERAEYRVEGIDFRAPLKTSASLGRAHSALRLRVPFATSDRLLALDIEEAALVMRRDEVQSLARALLPSFR